MSRYNLCACGRRKYKTSKRCIQCRELPQWSRNRELATKGLRWCALGRDGKGHEAPLSEFRSNGGKRKQLGYCHECARVADQAYKYGISIEEAWKRRESACEICGTTADLNNDHSHTTNELRGVRCRVHNVGLGCFHDNVAELRSAIEYLERWETAA